MLIDEFQMEVPDFRNIVAIKGREVILDTGEHVPTILYETFLSMKKGYRVVGIGMPYEEEQTSRAGVHQKMKALQGDQWTPDHPEKKDA